MFTDIHSHVIWGVDDGVSSFEKAQQLLRECAADGIDRIVTTPHVTPGHSEFPEERYLRHLEDTRAWLRDNDIPITLHTGAEILYTSYTERFLSERRLRTLADSGYMLVEFMPTDKYDRLRRAAAEIGNAGFTPVFAHVERYECLKKTDQIRELIDDFNVLIQVNAHTVTEKPSFFRRKFIYGLFEEDLVDFVGTDTHDMSSRHPNMKEAYARLSEWLGSEKADALTGGNQKMLFE